MHLTQYRRYENGNSEIPLNIAIKIAELYNVSIDYIAGRTENIKEKEYNEELQTLIKSWNQLNETEKAEIMNAIEYKIKTKQKTKNHVKKFF